MVVPEETLITLPHLPGVYIYRNAKGTVIYVGKAKDLKKRVSQYFQRDDAVGAKTAALVSQIATIETKTTDSEFDALLLEAKLIRTYLPKYNVAARDDKSPLYIAITMNESLPRIVFLRRGTLSMFPKATLFGPFQSGRTVRSILRMLRRVIPYCSAKERTGKPCFYTHLGLCDPCPSVIVKMEDSAPRRSLAKRYRQNMRKLISVLSGKSTTLLRSLERKMTQCAQKEQFEEAQRLHMQIESLRELLARHFDPHVYIEKGDFLQDVHDTEDRDLREALAAVYPDLPPLTRIECIDISNTFGQYATGSLVVFTRGVASTSDYRRFRIRTKEAPNDFAMIAEVLARRLAHKEWPYPNLLVIDGGKGQVQAAQSVLESRGVSVPVIGLAKRFEEIIVPFKNQWKVMRLPLSHRGLQLLERIRDESHRFALSYHRLLRSRAFLEDEV